MFGRDKKRQDVDIENMIGQIVERVADTLNVPNPERDMQLCRAASITVGTAFGGSLEISMRSNHGGYLYSILQPVEAIELIHQLAANVGCHIHLQPREDFASWREWKYTPEELAHFRGEQSLPGIGHPPHAILTSDLAQVGKQQPSKLAKEKENAVATKKAVNKRSPKRSRTTTK